MAQWFTAEQALNAFQIWVPLSLDGGSGEEAVSDQNIDFEEVENYSLENIFEVTNMSQMLNVLGNELWWWQWWWYKHLLKLNPSKLQKVTKYALFYSSVIVTLISGEFYIITTGRDPSVLDIDPGR